jgi:hypothetical protein
MESYEIEFQPSVRKDFRKLSPDNASRILPKIEELTTDPLPPQSIKLKGIAILNQYPDFLTAEAQRAQRSDNRDLASHLGSL